MQNFGRLKISDVAKRSALIYARFQDFNHNAESEKRSLYAWWTIPRNKNCFKVKIG